MERWLGRVAVVTGASSGIGAATCKDLVEQGIVVVGVARREERLKELKDKLKGKKGTFHYVKADLSKEAEVSSAFKWIKDNLGGVDVLVNNAASNTRGPVHEVKLEEWRNLYDINVFGVIACVQEAVKSMKERKFDGHIVIINSVAAHRGPYRNATPYCSSKVASRIIAEGLLRDLVAENSKIKVTALSPGLVETELFVNNNIPVDFSKLTHAKPKDIAEGIRYVISTPPNVQINEIIVRAVGDDI